MKTWLEHQLKTYLTDKNHAPKRLSYIKSKVKSHAYDRLLDNIDVLDKNSSYAIAEKIIPLVNRFYQQALYKVVGFTQLAGLNFESYNDKLSEARSTANVSSTRFISAFFSFFSPGKILQNFEERLQQFTDKELATDLLKPIQELADELISKAYDDLLMEEGKVNHDILNLLIKDPAERALFQTDEASVLLMKGFASEAVRQVVQGLRQQYPAYSEIAVWHHAFTAIELGLQRAITNRLRPKSDSYVMVENLAEPSCPSPMTFFDQEEYVVVTANPDEKLNASERQERVM